MFGYVCGGRPLETNVRQVEQTKFVFTVPDAARINYLALFLLPGMALPDEYAAAVYAQLPGKEDFQLLGSLTAQKQSAIFKLNLGAVGSATNDVDEMVDEDTPTGNAAGSDVVITFGISIEPAQQVEEYTAMQKLAARRPKQIASAPASAATAPSLSAPSDVASLANKIIRHAYNYLASFIDPQGKVPIKAFDDWWNKFKTRLDADPSFLKGLDEA